MVEKVITLDNISIVELLGVENKNIKEVASSFPTSKIITRGNEIKLIGPTPEIRRINEVIQSLIVHYQKYGKITEDNVQMYLEDKSKVKLEAEQSDEIILHGAKGKTIKPRSANQAKIVKAILEKDMAFVLGPAGSGKTYVAVALAVRALKNRIIKKIIITRPAVEAGENLGFLPGDMIEKIDPYLKPIYDALADMIPAEKLNFYRENGVIEIAPMAYMRGRTLDDAYVLLDEAQNTTPMQIKMFLTRIGPNAKMIITGDPTQVDLHASQKSGLLEAERILKDVKDIAFVYLEGDDVVRHKLVKDILKAYKKDGQ